MFFLPHTHKAHGLAYSPLKALIAPRPIGWISSLSKTGVANLAPYSFFNAISELPPMVMFVASSDRREGRQERQKDSLENILESREFGVNIVSKAHAEQMVRSGQEVAADIDEFELAGLVKKEGKMIRAPLVEGAPAQLECTYYDHIDLPDNDSNTSQVGAHNVMVLGRIVGFHIEESVLTESGLIDVTRYQPACRLGYKEYGFIEQVTEIKLSQ